MDYLPSQSVEDFERDFAARFPGMASALWLRRPGGEEVLDLKRVAPNEFGSDASGRGDSFRRAHQHSSVKATGMSTLLELATGCADARQIPADFRLLDVLGGSGTLARITRDIPRWQTTRNWVLTGDIAPEMVRQALAYGLPALRQPAQFLLCRDEAFNAVLVGYGAHHIPVPERPHCYEEAMRVLRPGGRLVVHDFEVGTAMVRWFEEAVHSYFPTGHDYIHFTTEDFEKDLRGVGFADVVVRTVYDPITVWADEPEQARAGVLRYMLDSYGLTPPGAMDDTELLAWVDQLVTTCIRYPEAALANLDAVPEPVRSAGTLTVYESSAGWKAELPRLALVAIATKAG